MSGVGFSFSLGLPLSPLASLQRFARRVDCAARRISAVHSEPSRRVGFCLLGDRNQDRSGRARIRLEPSDRVEIQNPTLRWYTQQCKNIREVLGSGQQTCKKIWAEFTSCMWLFLCGF